MFHKRKIQIFLLLRLIIFPPNLKGLNEAVEIVTDFVPNLQHEVRGKIVDPIFKENICNQSISGVVNLRKERSGLGKGKLVMPLIC